jgi:hypothetical protein
MKRSMRIDFGLSILSILARPGEPLTLQDIAAWCGCSHSAIQKIERRAIAKLGNRFGARFMGAGAGTARPSVVRPGFFRPGTRDRSGGSAADRTRDLGTRDRQSSAALASRRPYAWGESVPGDCGAGFSGGSVMRRAFRRLNFSSIAWRTMRRKVPSYGSGTAERSMSLPVRSLPRRCWPIHSPAIRSASFWLIRGRQATGMPCSDRNGRA